MTGRHQRTFRHLAIRVALVASVCSMARISASATSPPDLYVPFDHSDLASKKGAFQATPRKLVQERAPNGPSWNAHEAPCSISTTI